MKEKIPLLFLLFVLSAATSYAKTDKYREASFDLGPTYTQYMWGPDGFGGRFSGGADLSQFFSAHTFMEAHRARGNLQGLNCSHDGGCGTRVEYIVFGVGMKFYPFTSLVYAIGDAGVGALEAKISDYNFDQEPEDIYLRAFHGFLRGGLGVDIPLGFFRFGGEWTWIVEHLSSKRAYIGANKVRTEAFPFRTQYEARQFYVFIGARF